MRLRHYSCALIVMAATFAAVSQSRADVTYSYIADSSSYVGVAGTTADVKLYLLETVTPTSSGGRNPATSIVNMYFQDPTFANPDYTGVAQIGLGVTQVSVTGTKSQILGGPIYTPDGAKPGIQNNAGFTFSTAFQYTYSSGGSKTGGNGLSQLYLNLDDKNNSAGNGNNMQVAAGLGQGQSAGGFDAANGVLTDAPYVGGSKPYGTGKILVGTLHIQVGSGTTTFKVTPLAQTALQVGSTVQPQSAVNNGVTLTTVSGSDSRLNGSTGTTLLTTQIFNNPGVSNAVPLDVTNQSEKYTGSATYNSYNSINDIPTTPPSGQAGPTAGPAKGTTSFLPYWTASTTPFAFTVGTAAVPEPSSMALCGLITAAGAAYGVKRRRKTPTA